MNAISNRHRQYFSPRRALRQVSLCVFAPMIGEEIIRYAHMALSSLASLPLALKVGQPGRPDATGFCDINRSALIQFP